MSTVEVKLKLSNDVLAHLLCESNSRKIALDEVVSDVLADYFNEPTHEELLTGLKRSLKQVIDGDYRSAREFLDEIDNNAG